jgi:ectoine hydroxylase-related dioxygenase (phytanoyl-CoA dioxygenase family)
VDGLNQTELSPQQIRFFNEKGYLVVRNALSEIELDGLRKDTDQLIQNMELEPNHPDYWYNDDIPKNWYKNYSNERNNESLVGDVKKGIPFRIEYPVDKSDACKLLMGHAFILKAIEQLIGTTQFIPTWDSFVFKNEGNGVPIKWHRDASAETVDNIPAIDVGFYLDDANSKLNNCLYVIPGTHKWPDLLAASMIEFLTQDGFKTTGAVPVEVRPGDVILHNILILHGSPSCKSPLRRTVYYEYRSIDQERRMGPHNLEYIDVKQRLLSCCLNKRNKTNFNQLQNDIPYSYNVEGFNPEIGLETMRFPHKQYFRDGYKG